jgi:hypothetical protein
MTVFNSLIPIYTSDISFILHLPILLVPRYNYDWRILVPKWFKSRKNEPHESQLALFVALQVLIFITRISILVAISILIWNEIDSLEVASEPGQNKIKQTFIELLHRIRTSSTIYTCGWLFLSSTILWYISYRHVVFYYKSSKQNLRLPQRLQTISRYSIINFVLAVPDWGIPKLILPVLFVIICGISAGSLLWFLIEVRQPLIDCWGPYPLDSPLTNLDAGCGPDFFNDPQRPFTTACTKPGNICGESVNRWKNAYVHTMSLAGLILFISALVFFIYNPPLRSEYYNAKLEKHNTEKLKIIKKPV